MRQLLVKKKLRTIVKMTWRFLVWHLIFIAQFQGFLRVQQTVNYFSFYAHFAQRRRSLVRSYTLIHSFAHSQLSTYVHHTLNASHIAT